MTQLQVQCSTYEFWSAISIKPLHRSVTQKLTQGLDVIVRRLVSLRKPPYIVGTTVKHDCSKALTL